MIDRGPKLTIEPHPRNVTVARSFVVAGLAVLEVDEATREKARLVISELVTQLVAQSSTVVVLLVPEHPSIRVETGSPLPRLPDDVVRIIDALSGIAVHAEETCWTVAFEGA